MDISIEQRVTNGVEALDKHAPTWVRHVSERIDIRSLEHCILGQVFGDWTIGVTVLDIRGDRGMQELLGFELTGDEYNSESVDLIAEQIEDEWHSRIAARMGV